jgi:chemotaxis methyl-accepting protein methylase
MAGNTSGVVWIGQRVPLSNKFAHIVFAPSAAERFAARGDIAHIRTPPSEPAGFVLRGQPAEFLDWLFASAGLDWRAYRAETLQRRLASCLRSLRVPSLQDARRLIEREPQRRDEALNAILIGVTSFFRDERVFETLAASVLPQLIANRGALYAWSAGCSDGAELYSLAMLLDAQGCLSKSYLLGTDCRASALRVAKEGRYQAPARLSADWRSRYFEPTGDEWRVCPRLRQALRWRHANLLAGLEPGLWDLILFRNTAIYLRTEVSDRLWRQFETALRPGGVLMLGKAERPTGAKRLEPIGPCLYQRLWR